MTGSKCAAAVVALALIGGPAAAQLDPTLRPTHVAGAAINVRDLEAQKAWYMGKLGFSVVRSYDRDGRPVEYLLGLDDGADRALVVLSVSASRTKRPNDLSRLILYVPNARALAARLSEQGVPTHEDVPNEAYLVSDPEGNPIELFTPPKS